MCSAHLSRLCVTKAQKRHHAMGSCLHLLRRVLPLSCPALACSLRVSACADAVVLRGWLRQHPPGNFRHAACACAVPATTRQSQPRCRCSHAQLPTNKKNIYIYIYIYADAPQFWVQNCVFFFGALIRNGLVSSWSLRASFNRIAGRLVDCIDIIADLILQGLSHACSYVKEGTGLLADIEEH